MAQFADPELRERFRLVALDLHGHGESQGAFGAVDQEGSRYYPVRSPPPVFFKKMEFAYSGRKDFGMRGANMRNRFGSILRKANFRVSAKQLERIVVA
jgi:pimeloyl-ACP methyl ester carboxylesterase